METRRLRPTGFSAMSRTTGTKPIWKTDTLAAKNLEKFTFLPDPYHYNMSPKEMAHAKREAAGKEHSPIEIQTANVKRLSAFVPGHSTYFAIYFTLTALHGLHVFGG